MGGFGELISIDDDRLAIKAIPSGFRLVAADDVAPTLDCYLLGK
jgi:hypothetical protein